MQPLNNISVLLVETQSAGNIGSVARAMKNMGASELILVNCQTELTEEATHFACGAGDILERCLRFGSLEEALGRFNLSIATTSRRVEWIPRVYCPNELPAQLANLSPFQKVALVFGPERTGLTNDHLHLCQWLVTIPSNPQFESLNLAHAVAIVLYELSSRRVKTSPGRSLQLARLDQVEAFFHDLQASLIEIGFLNREDPERIMGTLRQILARAILERRDVSILRGILRQWSWYAGQLTRRKSQPR